MRGQELQHLKPQGEHSLWVSLSLRLSVYSFSTSPFPPKPLECRLTDREPGDRHQVSGTAFQVLTTSSEVGGTACLSTLSPSLSTGFYQVQTQKCIWLQAINHEQEPYQGWRGATNRKISPTAKYKPVTSIVPVENWMRFPMGDCPQCMAKQFPP